MDLDRVEIVVKLFGASRAQELVVEADDWSVSLRRGHATSLRRPFAVVETPIPDLGIEEVLLEAETAAVTAPLVGIFRQGNGRIEVGEILHVGDEVGSIESMKILSPVVCEVAGRVLEVLIEDGHPVAYGQPLYLLDPLPDEGEEAGP
jgi:biotin carboxyl carrier protein